MDDFDDKIFNNDPIYMKTLVGKKAAVETIENITYSGIVYVIDPIYKTVVLHTNWRSDNDHGTVFILYHAIKSLKVLSEEVVESYLKETEVPQSTDNIVEKKAILKTWLKQMYINVSESGNYLKIDDHLLIAPPYGPENCISNNTIVLDKIRKVIGLMPPDFNPHAHK